MSTPTTKSPEIDQFLRQTGFNRIDAVTSNKCVFCGQSCPESSFRDLPSLREFKISGICQICQDATFN